MQARVDTTALVAGLDRAGTRLANLDDVASSAARVVFARADSLVPRDTGTLASSGSAVVVDSVGTVVYAARYARAVHAKNPWAARALDATEGAVFDLYADAAQDALDQIHT